MSKEVITEEMLRQRFGLGRGSEIHLPMGCTLTPEARALIHERQIRIRFIDAQGRLFASPEEAEPRHPLTGKSQAEEKARPSLRKTGVASEHLTHLDAHTLVAKSHPRILLRGKLDTLIALTVLAEHDFDREQHYPWLHAYLADIRSAAGRLLRDEVTGEDSAAVSLGNVDAEMLHAISHNPLRYLGHDHIVPAREHGRNVALLNLLRAQAREVEVEVVRAFTTPEQRITRPALLTAANRLSSALYVLMLLTLLAQKGEKSTLESLAL